MTLFDACYSMCALWLYVYYCVVGLTTTCMFPNCPYVFKYFCKITLRIINTTKESTVRNKNEKMIFRTDEIGANDCLHPPLMSSNRYHPTDDEVHSALQSVIDQQPNLGVDRLRKSMMNTNKNWVISSKVSRGLHFEDLLPLNEIAMTACTSA